MPPPWPCSKQRFCLRAVIRGTAPPFNLFCPKLLIWQESPQNRHKAHARGKKPLEKKAKNPLVFSLSAPLYPSAETWPSGRRRSPAKGVGPEGSRGFESHRLRHIFNTNT